jgi:hypothetical protein
MQADAVVATMRQIRPRLNINELPMILVGIKRLNVTELILW